MNTTQKTTCLFHRPGILIALVAVGLLLMSVLLSSVPIHANSPGSGEEEASVVAAQEPDVELGQTPEGSRVVVKPLHNVQADFAQGSFNLTAVNTDQKGEDGNVSQYSPKFPDEPGAVQLLPVIPLEPFTLTNNSALPIKLTNMGVTSLGKYIFVIGGDQRDNPGPDENPIRDVYIGEVDNVNGDTVTWSADPDCPEEDDGGSTRCLPEIETNNDKEFFDEESIIPNAGTSEAAVTSVSTGENSGYIYVIGGNVKPIRNDNDIYSSAATLIGSVVNGQIVNWQTAPLIMDPRTGEDEFGPEAAERSYGLRSAMAVSYTNPQQRTFIYLIGGFHRGYYPVQEGPSNRVFYAEVNHSNGRLYKPGTSEEGWEVLEGTIPLPPSPTFSPGDFGLWNAVAFAHSSAEGEALYVLGGERLTSPSAPETERYSYYMYRADIAPDGKLTWQENEVATLPQNPVYAMGKAQYGENLYITGGVEVRDAPGEDDYPTAKAFRTFLDGLDPLEDPWVGASTKENPLLYTRKKHGMAVIPADHPSVLAYIYAIAGQSSVVDRDPGDDGSEQGTDTVLFSKIDRDNPEKVYPSSGTYTSEYIDIPDDERFTGIEWSAYVSRTDELGTDIMMEYRVDVNSRGCDADNLFSSSQWIPISATASLDYHSNPGRNVGNMIQTDIDKLDTDEHGGACFQYRATLISKSTPKETPLLLNVYRRVKETVLPELYPRVRMQVRNLAPEGEDPDMQVTLDLSVINLNETPEKTDVADFDGYDRHFFMDLFIFGPGQENVFDSLHEGIRLPFPTIYTPTIEAESHYYSTLPKSHMLIAHEQVMSPTMWAEANNPAQFTLEEKLEGLSITNPYTACMIVDSFIETQRDLYNWPEGYVIEARENNNVACDSLEVADYQVWIKAEDIDGTETDKVHEKEDDDTPQDEQLHGIFKIGIADDKTAPQGGLEVSFAVITGEEGEEEQQETPTIFAATYNVDYTLENIENNGTNGNVQIQVGNKGGVTIPEGENYIVFEVMPRDDDLHEGDEVVTYRLQIAPEVYDVDPDNMQATVTILDNEHILFLPVVAR